MKPFQLLPLLLAPLLSQGKPVPSAASSTAMVRRDNSSWGTSWDIPRLVIYFQTETETNGAPVSLLPLVTEKGIALTHLIVAAFHINNGSTITLNDDPPNSTMYDTLWEETKVLQNAGIHVMGMLGGAAPGSYDNDTLDSTDEATFEHYYSQLANVVQDHGLDGIDIDVEQPMSLAGAERLVSRLRSDFGPDFIITMAPVATALMAGGDNAEDNLSGFSYEAIQTAEGSSISFLNTQFYSGFGSMATPASYEAVVDNGWSPLEIVAGQLTSPANGDGYTTLSDLNQTVIALREEYGQIGGVMGWEYFNSDPGGEAEPWEWAQIVTAILRPDDKVNLTITDATAEALVAAWNSSVAGTAAEGDAPTVDYMAMVNA